MKNIKSQFLLKIVFLLSTLAGGITLFPRDGRADAQIELNPDGRRVRGSDGNTQIEFRIQQGELVLDDRRKKRHLPLSADDLARGEVDISPDGLVLVWYRKAAHAIGAPLLDQSPVMVVWQRLSVDEDFKQVRSVTLGDLKIPKPSRSVSHLRWSRGNVLDWNRHQLMIRLENQTVLGIDLRSGKLDQYVQKEFQVHGSGNPIAPPSKDYALKIESLMKELEKKLAQISTETDPEKVKALSEAYRKDIQKQVDAITKPTGTTTTAPGPIQNVSSWNPVRVELPSENKVLELDLPDFFGKPSVHIHGERITIDWTSSRSTEIPTRVEFIIRKKPLPKENLPPGLQPNPHGTYIQTSTNWLGYCWFTRFPITMDISISAQNDDQGRWIWLGLQRSLKLAVP